MVCFNGDPLASFTQSMLKPPSKGSLKKVGKPTKKDKKKGKSTLINLLGYKNALIYAEKLKKKILLNLKKHGKNAKELTDTVKFILQRNF